MSEAVANRLDRPVDNRYDHILGADHAEITLVEYGSYACPHCRAANERIAEIRNQLGDRLRYVFRHRPLTGSDIARRAAELVEQADERQFWEAHMKLMSRSETLTEDDLLAVAQDLGVGGEGGQTERARRAQARVADDERSARASGVAFTPTFFINGRRYEGAWDHSSFSDALFGSLGHRMRAAALDFANWAPSTGVLLLLASVIALLVSNMMWGAAFENFWRQPLGMNFGAAHFQMPLLHWVNDGLLTIFFLVVGLEIKREFTIGHLAGRRAAALPVAAAIGGMVVPAIIYALLAPGEWARGWGVPMPTDTAFAVALIIMLGQRVPVELRIFLTAAAIVDDIGAILVVAMFYSSELHWTPFVGAVVVTGCLAMLNRWRVYRASPYVLLGLALWACVHASGLHATLAGVLLAFFIPTRPPPNLRALRAQADALLADEARHGGEVLRGGPSEPTMRALDAIHDRLESPAGRMLRHVGPRSSYIVLPLFALANAGVELSAAVFAHHGALMFAIACGLVIGKPLGLTLASLLAVKLKLAIKPDEYSWTQLFGAGALAGIGFTMSLFIANQAFPAPEDFAAAKIAVFAASLLSALLGVAVLWKAAPAGKEGEVGA